MGCKDGQDQETGSENDEEGICGGGEELGSVGWKDSKEETSGARWIGLGGYGE